MATIVESAGSMYWPALNKIYKDVQEGMIFSLDLDFQCFTTYFMCSQYSHNNNLFTTGLKEAWDIVIFLKPLQKILDEIEQLDYPLVNPT